MDLVEFMGDISSTIIHDEEERLWVKEKQ
jgi:hypothetical protein